MAMEKRRTLRTDSNGNLLDAYKTDGLAAKLARAREAGIPGFLLDPRGWDGDPDGDGTGLFADLIYRLSELPLKGPLHPMSDAAEIIDWATQLCEANDVDVHEAITFPDLVRYVRELNCQRAGCQRCFDKWHGSSDYNPEIW